VLPAPPRVAVVYVLFVSDASASARGRTALKKQLNWETLQRYLRLVAYSQAASVVGLRVVYIVVTTCVKRSISSSTASNIIYNERQKHTT
jgi:hypothetical protein